MKKSLIVFFCICICLTSCLFNKKTLYLKSDNKTELKIGDDVRINGCKIGTVDKVYLTNDFQSLVKINFDENTHIPIESRFTIKSTDLFGTKAINIIPGKSKRYIPYGDTVQFNINVDSTLADSLSVKVEHFLNRIIRSESEDSLIKEVKKLNDKVEDLKKELKEK